MEGSDRGEAGKEQQQDTSLPPGFRFHPTDEELITFYLVNKISDSSFTGRAIADVDLNKCEPWELPGKAKMGEKEWYFFSMRDRKYPTGVRTNRATNTGYWKTTGKDKEIFNSVTSELVGMKKTLVFYRGRAPRGEKTNWVMHEYRIHSKSSFRTTKDEWVVCRVFQKSAGVKKYPSHPSRPGVGLVNPYLDMGSTPMPKMMPPDPYSFPGRSYPDQLPDLSRVLRPNTLPTYPHIYPPAAGPAFTISGLNLNLGSPMPPPLAQQQQQEVAASMINSNPFAAEAAGYVPDMSSATDGANSKYMGLDQCMDLDNYWASY